MTNSEIQITEADRAAADGILAALSVGSRSADDLAYMVAVAMAPERAASRKAQNALKRTHDARENYLDNWVDEAHEHARLVEKVGELERRLAAADELARCVELVHEGNCPGDAECDALAAYRAATKGETDD